LKRGLIVAKNRKKNRNYIPKKKTPFATISTNTLLDKMEKGREYESILKYRPDNLELHIEIRKFITEIEEIRKKFHSLF